MNKGKPSNRSNRRGWPELIQHYGRVFRPRTRREQEWFRQQPSPGSAVRYAALAENEKGHRYRHQSRISRGVLEEAADLLSRALPALRKARSFHELHRLVKEIVGDIHGIGRLYVYDTSFRIGSKLGFLPKKVYLHAGTQHGARALGLDGTEWLEVSQLPAGLRMLPAYEVEDILCLYKDRIPRERGCSQPTGLQGTHLGLSGCGGRRASESRTEGSPLLNLKRASLG